jgi:hypothetical protein
MKKRGRGRLKGGKGEEGKRSKNAIIFRFSFSPFTLITFAPAPAVGK